MLGDIPPFVEIKAEPNAGVGLAVEAPVRPLALEPANPGAGAVAAMEVAEAPKPANGGPAHGGPAPDGS